MNEKSNRNQEQKREGAGHNQTAPNQADKNVRKAPPAQQIEPRKDQNPQARKGENEVRRRQSNSR